MERKIAITKREYDVLRVLSYGTIESRGGLYPAGEGTIARLIASGWIDPVPEGAVGLQMGYRITEAGKTAYEIGCTPKSPRQPVRVMALQPRVRPLPPRIGKLD